MYWFTCQVVFEGFAGCFLLDLFHIRFNSVCGGGRDEDTPERD